MTTKLSDLLPPKFVLDSLVVENNEVNASQPKQCLITDI
jgi:hypothetical protein